MLPKWVVETVVKGLFSGDYKKNMCSSGELTYIIYNQYNLYLLNNEILCYNYYNE